jgi:hypothetical protein
MQNISRAEAERKAQAAAFLSALAYQSQLARSQALAAAQSGLGGINFDLLNFGQAQELALFQERLNQANLGPAGGGYAPAPPPAPAPYTPPPAAPPPPPVPTAPQAARIFAAQPNPFGSYRQPAYNPNAFR